MWFCDSSATAALSSIPLCDLRLHATVETAFSTLFRLSRLQTCTCFLLGFSSNLPTAMLCFWHYARIFTGLDPAKLNACMNSVNNEAELSLGQKGGFNVLGLCPDQLGVPRVSCTSAIQARFSNSVVSTFEEIYSDIKTQTHCEVAPHRDAVSPDTPLLPAPLSHLPLCHPYPTCQSYPRA